jgi:hypothetical protein
MLKRREESYTYTSVDIAGAERARRRLNKYQELSSKLWLSSAVDLDCPKC